MKKCILLFVCAAASIVATTVFASGTYTVGAGQTYTTLKAAFDAINSGAITGDIVLQIAANSSEVTGQGGSVSLNASGTGTLPNISSYTSVLIYPTVTGRTIQGFDNKTLVLTLNGADNVTIDGRLRDVNGVIQNQNKELSLNGAVGTITFTNDACLNTIKYCNIKNYAGNNPISFTAGTSVTGNDNNTITYNNISGGHTATRYGINVAAGTTGKENNNNEISYNNIFDVLALGSNGYFIGLGTYNKDWTISNNSFYLTTSYSLTHVNANQVINLVAANNSGHIVENNYIGGSAPQCAGTMSVDKSTASSTMPFEFISINKSVANETKIIVRNNTIKNIQIGANATGAIRGIVGQSASATDSELSQIDGNFICGINILGSSNLIGLDLSIATNAIGSFSVTNNVVSLITNGLGSVIGINEDNNSANNKRYIYNNTIYIGGSANSANNSIAYNCLRDLANTRRIKNNIFVNVRSNSGAGKNYAVWYNTTATSVDADYNIYYVSGTNSVLARYNGADDADLPIMSGDDTNSSIADPVLTISSPTLLSDYRSTITQTTGGASDYAVAKDIEGITRTLAQKGAFFLPTIVPISGNTTNPAGLTAASQLEVAAGVELTFTTSPNVSKIILAPTAKLTMGANTITAPNGVVLQSSAAGTATLTGDAPVSNATVQQYLTYTRNYYVSSPVSNAVAPAGYTYYRRDESLSAAGWVPVSTGASLAVGKGYTALPGTGASPITFTTQNGGTLNTGNITIPLTYTTEATSGKGYNLIGNPYPSHLSWTYAFTQAKKDTIESSIWYRTKASNGNAGGGWSFVTFNPTTAETVPSTINGGLIPPMQGFWVLAKRAGTIQLTNDMRSHQTGNPLRVKAAQSADRKKVRLRVSNGTRADEALIVFDANATDGYDAYDSPKMMNNATDIADIYTVADAKNLVINGMNSVKYNAEIPVGFSTLSAGDFSISANEFSNFETDAQLVLLDKELTKEFDLSKGASYNFSSGITAANANRFSILFRAPGATTGVNTVEKRNAQVFVNAANQITIVAPEKANYAIYNAMGQLIENGVLNMELQTVNCKLQTGIYVVKVGTESKRVIIK